MLKITRRIFKLFLPTWYMHRRLRRKFGINVLQVSESSSARFAVSLLPYFVSAILQQRKPTDRRIYKYFLPYGKMCDHLFTAYGKTVRNAKKDSGICGMFRSILPYGLILWWDEEDRRLEIDAIKKQTPAANPVPKVTPMADSTLAEIRNMRDDVTRVFQNMCAMQDRLEILSLRIIMGNRLPSVSIILTGGSNSDDLISAIKRLSASSVTKLEIIAAANNIDSVLNEDIVFRPDVKVVAVKSDGLTNREVCNLALSKATGDYVAFLEVGDYYATDDMLEYLTLRAMSENAAVYGGRVSIGWKNPCVGISSMLFDRVWLMSSGLEVIFNVRANDGIFVQCAKALAVHSVILQRTVVNHVPVCGESNYTEQERKEDFLNSIACASRLVEGVVQKDALLQEIGKIFRENSDVLRNLVWKNGCVQNEQADLVQETASNIGMNDLADDIINPLVSFIIPVYNVENLLGRCLTSILNLSLESFEIICVDDGSTDNSFSVLQSFANADSRIKIYSQENGGQGAARNYGIQQAKGKYIQFVDADDFIDSTMYPQVLQPFDMYSDLDFIQFSAVVNFDFTPSETQIRWGENLFKNQLKEGIHNIDSDSFISTVVWNKVYKTSFIRENGLIFPGCVKQEDEAFTFFVFSRAKKFYYFNNTWYKYVRTETGTMSTQDSNAQSEKMPDVYAVFNFIFEFLNNESSLQLIGFFFKRVIGATTRFNNTSVQEQCRDCAASLLRKSNFYLYRDLMCSVDSSEWLKNFGRDLYCRELSAPLEFPKINSKFPIQQIKERSTCAPKLAYVVLMDTFETFAPLCIQSLVAQTESDIEILCVTTKITDQLKIVIDRFSVHDERIKLIELGMDANFDKRQQLRMVLESIKSNYIVIHEAKNTLPCTHAHECIKATEYTPDLILVPDEYFDTSSFKPIDQCWMYRKQASKYPKDVVWNIDDCTTPCFQLDTNHHCYKRSFFEEFIESSPEWSFWPNATLLYLITSASSITIAKNTCCHIRLGNLDNTLPLTEDRRVSINKSFVQNIFSIVNSQSFKSRVLKTQVYVLFYILDKTQWLFDRTPQMCEMMEKARDELPLYLSNAFASRHSESWEKLNDAICNNQKSSHHLLPSIYDEKLNAIEKARASINQDMYVVIAFLTDAFAECIDSWTFFTYLKRNSIPAKYIIPEYNQFYKTNVVNSEFTSDVIAICNDKPNSYEILEKMIPFMYRIKAVIMEDGYLPNGLSLYFRNLDRCAFALLGHGVIYIWLNELLVNMISKFNLVNTSGMPEFERLSKYMDEENSFSLIKGGLPRFDLLAKREKTGAKKPSILVALSWRNDFGNIQLLKDSYFYKKLIGLLNSSVWDEFSNKGIEVVVALHHALRRQLGVEFNLDSKVKVIEPMEISRYIRESDCLVTDLSSIAFDFLYQYKPVVFWIPDVDDYAMSYVSRSKVLDARKSISRMFNLSESIIDVENKLREYVDSNFTLPEKECEIVEKLFYPRGHNSERFYHEIEKYWHGKYNKVEETL